MINKVAPHLLLGWNEFILICIRPVWVSVVVILISRIKINILLRFQRISNLPPGINFIVVVAWGAGGACACLVSLVTPGRVCCLLSVCLLSVCLLELHLVTHYSQRSSQEKDSIAKESHHNVLPYQWNFTSYFYNFMKLKLPKFYIIVNCKKVFWLFDWQAHLENKVKLAWRELSW